MFSTQQTRLIVSFIVLVMLVIISFWVLEVLKRTHVVNKTAVNNKTADYEIYDFRLLHNSNQDGRYYLITGKKLAHMPADDTQLITEPLLTIIDKPQNTKTYVQSRYAILKNQQTSKTNSLQHNKDYQIDFYQQVKAKRETIKELPYQISTEHLRLLPDQHLLESDQAVLLEHDTLRAFAHRMRLNYTTKQLELSENVQAFYR